jgi:hypothetical protein
VVVAPPPSVLVLESELDPLELEPLVVVAATLVPGLDKAATTEKPSVAVTPARVTPRVMLRSRSVARLRSAGERRCAVVMARSVAYPTFRSDYAETSRGGAVVVVEVPSSGSRGRSATYAHTPSSSTSAAV